MTYDLIIIGAGPGGYVAAERAAALIEAEFRATEIEDIVFPHPTASEIIREAIISIH